MDAVSEFHTKAPQATVNEGLAHGSYLAARQGFEPATFRTKGVESTDKPPRPTVFEGAVFSVWSERAVERWQEVRFERVRRMGVVPPVPVPSIDKVGGRR